MLILPTEKKKIKTNPQEYLILLYGPPKTGKSTFCSEMEGALFISTEPGLSALSVMEAPITNWTEFLEICAELSKPEQIANPDKYKTIIIDTVDNLFSFCSAEVLMRAGITHESDLDWGKGWSLIRNEFARAIQKMVMLPYGFVFVSHTDMVEQKGKNGNQTKSLPSIQRNGYKVLHPLVDFLFFIAVKDKDGKKVSVIKTKPSYKYDAGDRTGLLPEEMPLDYKIFKAEFEKAIKSKLGE